MNPPITNTQFPIILGITGLKQSGKDTSAQLLIKHLYPYRSIRLAFADSLKNEVASLFGISAEELEARKSLSGMRKFLQWWGTELSRRDNDNHWIELLHEKVSKVPEDTAFVIITDCRFLNEAKYIRDNKGMIFRVQRGYTDNKDLHSSETEQSKIIVDHTIDNSFKLERLDFECKNMAAIIKDRFKL